MDKKMNDMLRAKFVAAVMKAMVEMGEEVMQTATGEFAIPTIDDAGEDNCVVISVKVPTGSRDGEAYDPYAAAEDYKLKVAERAEKAKAAAEKKAEKIAKAKAEKEAKAKAKAEAKARAEQEG